MRASDGKKQIQRALDANEYIDTHTQAKKKKTIYDEKSEANSFSSNTFHKLN